MGIVADGGGGLEPHRERQVLSVDAGPSEDAAFWTAFLRDLKRRGLQGVRLVISDAHEGSREAVATVLTRATWQRCRVRFMRNLLAVVPKGAREAVAAVVRTIFGQPDHASAVAQAAPGDRGTATARLREAAEDMLAHLHFPKAYRWPASTPPTRSSGSTRRSSTAPTSSGSPRRAGCSSG